MKRNKLTLIIVLIVLIAAYFVLRGRGPGQALLPLYDLDTLKIAQIEVFDNADTLKLQRQSGVWMLTEPVKWEADTLRINEMFRKVFSAKYSRTPMGEGQDAIARFKLKENEALHILVSDKSGTKRIHTMFSNMGNAYDYFRYAGSDKVYQIKTKVINSFTTELPMWRSPHVVNHAESELLKLEISHANNSYTLTRKEFDWFYKDARLSFKIPISNLAIMKIVSILASLDTYVFVDEGGSDIMAKFAQPYCTVKIYLSKNRVQELKFASYQDNQFMMLVDNDPSVVFIVSMDTVFRFTRAGELFQLDGY